MQPAGDRVNVLLVFVAFITAAVLFHHRSSYSRLVLPIIAILSIVANFNVFENMQTAYHDSEKIDIALRKYKQEHDLDTILIAYYSPVLSTQYSYFYREHHCFGIDSSLRYTGVLVDNNYSYFARGTDVHTKISNDTLDCSIINDDYAISIGKEVLSAKRIDNKRNARGFSQVKCIILRDQNVGVNHLVSYSDSGWTDIE